MITEGFLARHHMGRAGMAAPALLDVAQDYALHHLHQQTTPPSQAHPPAASTTSVGITRSETDGGC